nr:MAG TPA: hypothetical protein [Caudoviricetes sp.]
MRPTIEAVFVIDENCFHCFQFFNICHVELQTNQGAKA